MGSDAHLIVVGGAPGLVTGAQDRIDQLERRWSRFIDDSEVCELNRRAGQAVPVSDDTVLLVRRAVEAWHVSGGAFDPTLLAALTAAGYDRSFELLAPRAATLEPPLSISPGSNPDEIVVGEGSVQLPEGCGFDPGGIGKGLAADLVCQEILRDGADGVCVNLGGDVRVAGAGPDGGTWTVAVEHPRGPDPIALVGLTDGAVATSTTLRRTWTVGDEVRHHVIDPHTGWPSNTDLALATVIAGEAWMAEVLAKAVLLAGSAHPFDIVGGTGAQALAVDRDGRVSATGGFADFLGTVALPEAIVVR